MIRRKGYNIKFIDEYLIDELYRFEVESKGCLLGVIVETEKFLYNLDFYDITRFAQDVNDTLVGNDFVYEYNIIILKKVTLQNVVDAIDKLWLNKTFSKMIGSKR